MLGKLVSKTSQMQENIKCTFLWPQMADFIKKSPISVTCVFIYKIDIVTIFPNIMVKVFLSMPSSVSLKTRVFPVFLTMFRLTLVKCNCVIIFSDMWIFVVGNFLSPAQPRIHEECTKHCMYKTCSNKKIWLISVVILT